MNQHQTIDPELAGPNDLEKALIGVNAKTGRSVFDGAFVVGRTEANRWEGWV